MLQKANSSHVWEHLNFFLVCPLERSYLRVCIKFNIAKIANANAYPITIHWRQTSFSVENKIISDGGITVDFWFIKSILLIDHRIAGDHQIAGDHRIPGDHRIAGIDSLNLV